MLRKYKNPEKKVQMQRLCLSDDVKMKIDW